MKITLHIYFYTLSFFIMVHVLGMGELLEMIVIHPLEMIVIHPVDDCLGGCTPGARRMRPFYYMLTSCHLQRRACPSIIGLAAVKSQKSLRHPRISTRRYYHHSISTNPLIYSCHRSGLSQERPNCCNGRISS